MQMVNSHLFETWGPLTKGVTRFFVCTVWEKTPNQFCDDNESKPC